MAQPNGYTFLELCVVIFILLVLLQMTTPVISTALDRQETRSFLERLSTELYWAESQARARQTMVYVDVYPSWSFYLIRINTKVAKRIPLPQGYKLTSNFPSDRITFHTDGQIERNGTITMVNRKGDQYYVVFQLSSGRFYVTRKARHE